MNFREAEEKYAKLRKDYDDGLITLDEFKAQVKSLIVKDHDGNIWSIGIKSGKWYKKVGNEWVRTEPPRTTDTQRLIIENLLPDEEEENSLICPKCGKEVPAYYVFCPYCGARIREDEEAIEREYSLKKIEPFSLAFIIGGFGIIIGVIAGAFAEVLAPKLLVKLGLTFPNLGILWKSFIYSLLTGVFSFFLFFLIGFILALLANLILSIFGGLKFSLS